MTTKSWSTCNLRSANGPAHPKLGQQRPIWNLKGNFAISISVEWTNMLREFIRWRWVVLAIYFAWFSSQIKMESDTDFYWIMLQKFNWQKNTHLSWKKDQRRGFQGINLNICNLHVDKDKTQPLPKSSWIASYNYVLERWENLNLEELNWDLVLASFPHLLLCWLPHHLSSPATPMNVRDS